MTDRILDSAWWLTVMLMICAAGAVALFVGYRGLLELIAARWTPGSIYLCISILATVAVVLLCRHRNDLLP